MNLERDPGFETLAEKSQGSLLDTRVNTGQSVLPLSTSCLDQVSEFTMGAFGTTQVALDHPPLEVVSPCLNILSLFNRYDV